VYHKANKDNQYVRKALFESFQHKCAYCGDLVKPKNMHVDHILASKHRLRPLQLYNVFRNAFIILWLLIV